MAMDLGHFTRDLVVRLVTLISAAILLFVTFSLLQIVYRLFLHPLSSFLGPKSWATSNIPRYFYEFRGTIDYKICSLHARYGDVVRISPDTLTFNSSPAFNDIHGYGTHNLEKDPLIKSIVLAGFKESGIVQAARIDHARMRRQLAHAFSEQALKEQEPILQSYIDTLVFQLKDAAASQKSVDLKESYMHTTIDIVSRLAFGTSFDTLKNDQFRKWIKLQSGIGFQILLMKFVKAFPFTRPILLLGMPPEVADHMRINRQHVQQTVRKRLDMGVMEEKRDFLSYILKHKNEDVGMTDGEIFETSRSLILAGADTTKMLLSSVTFLLLRNPEALEKVTHEVRAAFETEQEINYRDATTRLPYMLACLDEALRIHPPAASLLFSRHVPAGPPMQIAKHEVPGDTTVCVHPLSTHTSPRNFHAASSFHPERWLPSAHDEASPFRHDNRAAFQPFFIGPRSCIGRNLAYSQMRLILARVLWNFDLELCKESQDWIEQRCWLVWEEKALWCRVKMRAG